MNTVPSYFQSLLLNAARKMVQAADDYDAVDGEPDMDGATAMRLIARAIREAVAEK